MPSTLRAGLVGCGKIGRTHAAILHGLDGSSLVAVCHPRQERAAEFGAEYGARGYADLDKMLERERLDVLSVCTPHPAHVEAVVAAAEHGVNVLVEKPLAPDLAGCDAAIAACGAHRVKLAVVSQRRFYAPVVRMREAIQDGKIGTPVLADLVVLGWRDRAYYESDRWRGTWDGEGGGVLMNQCPHQLDLLQWLMGPIDELFGYWENLNHPYIEVEDTALAVIKFRSGALASVLLSNSQKPGLYGRLHLHGSNGASIGAQTESGSPFIAGVPSDVEPPINDLWTVPREESLLGAWQAEDRASAEQRDVTTYYHQLQIADFLEAIRSDRTPLVDGQEGRKVVEIITGIYRSQRDHCPITFPLQPEPERTDFDGRLGYTPLSRRRIES
ncbi:MAG: Gfo/Idh/MocA family oxidoreductase [Candidatus Limnocylindrales bacterium]|jgi:predicted dehydrogenase